MIAVVDLEVFNPSTREVEVLRLTSGSHFIEGNNQYLPYIEELPNYGQSIFSSGLSDGELSSSSGTLSLTNVDGKFDYLENWGIAGRPITVRLAKDENSVATPYFKGIVTYPIFDYSSIVLNLSNSIEDLNTPSIVETFKGTNIGPEGLEGNESDSKGLFKPFCLGRVFNIPLTVVNTSLQIYACNYNFAGERQKIEAVWSVRVKGGSLTFFQDFATSEVLSAAALPAGTYATCLSEGLVRLGVVPVGTVTADIDESFPQVSDCSSLIRKLLVERLGKVEGPDFDGGSLNSISEFNSCPLGLFVNSEKTFLECVNSMLNSVGAWMTSDPSGKYVFGFFSLEKFSSIEHDLKITEDTFVSSSLSKLPTGFEDRNTPSYKVELGHTLNNQTIGEVLVSVDPALSFKLVNDYRLETRDSSDLLEMYPNSKPLRYVSLLQEPRTAYFQAANLAENFFNSNFYVIQNIVPSWQGNQVSGTLGSFDFLDGSCQITSGTGTYEVVQTRLVDSLSVKPGAWRLTLQHLSGNGQVILSSNLGQIVASTISSSERLVDLSFEITSDMTQLSVSIRAVGSGAVARFKNLKVFENLANDPVQKELDRRFQLATSRQSRISLEIESETFSEFLIGKVANLQINRYGSSEGKNYVIVNSVDLLTEGVKRLTLWRAEQ